jgi:hypothetical protein
MTVGIPGVGPTHAAELKSRLPQAVTGSANAEDDDDRRRP